VLGSLHTTRVLVREHGCHFFDTRVHGPWIRVIVCTELYDYCLSLGAAVAPLKSLTFWRYTNQIIIIIIINSRHV